MSSRLPFAGYLTAQAISVTGTRVSTIAIPWFVLTTTGSATLTGVVAFAEMAPLVTLQALSGPIMDRLGARRVAITCDLVSLFVVGTIPVAHVLGMLSFPLLLALVVLAGSLRGPGDAAKHAMLPVLVEQVGMPTERATGLTGAVERGASMAGAALAGGLVALLGAADALVVDAASFLVSGLILLVTTTAAATSRPEPSSSPTSYLSELRSGWDFMRRDPILMGIGVMVALTNLLDAAWSSVLVPVWAQESGRGVAAVGLLGATFGGAAILGSVIAAAYGARLPRYYVYVVAFLIAGVPRFVVLAFDSPWAVIIPVAVAGGFASGFLNPLLGAVLFERIPAALMGRVTSMNLAMSWSLIPFGGLLGGVLVAGVGFAPAMLIAGAGYFVTTMAPTVQPRWRELDDRPAPKDLSQLSDVEHVA
ncbi:MAG: transporter permease [Nocardioidaceae bacterium]|nr:transporter permease [Nocardioidaceae bacterium]